MEGNVQISELLQQLEELKKKKAQNVKKLKKLSKHVSKNKVKQNSSILPSNILPDIKKSEETCNTVDCIVDENNVNNQNVSVKCRCGSLVKDSALLKAENVQHFIKGNDKKSELMLIPDPECEEHCKVYPEFLVEPQPEDVKVDYKILGNELDNCDIENISTKTKTSIYSDNYVERIQSRKRSSSASEFTSEPPEDGEFDTRKKVKLYETDTEKLFDPCAFSTNHKHTKLKISSGSNDSLPEAESCQILEHKNEKMLSGDAADDDCLENDMTCFLSSSLLDSNEDQGLKKAAIPNSANSNDICPMQQKDFVSKEERDVEVISNSPDHSQILLSVPYSIDSSQNDYKSFNFPKFSSPTTSVKDDMHKYLMEGDLAESSDCKKQPENGTLLKETVQSIKSVSGHMSYTSPNDEGINVPNEKTHALNLNKEADDYSLVSVKNILGNGLSSALDAHYGSPVKQDSVRKDNINDLLLSSWSNSQNVPTEDSVDQLFQTEKISYINEPNDLKPQVNAPSLCDKFSSVGHCKTVANVSSDYKDVNVHALILDSRKSTEDSPQSEIQSIGKKLIFDFIGEAPLCDQDGKFEGIVECTVPSDDISLCDDSETTKNVSYEVKEVVMDLAKKVNEEDNGKNPKRDLHMQLDQYAVQTKMEKFVPDSEVFLVPETELFGIPLSSEMEPFSQESISPEKKKFDSSEKEEFLEQPIPETEFNCIATTSKQKSTLDNNCKANLTYFANNELEEKIAFSQPNTEGLDIFFSQTEEQKMNLEARFMESIPDCLNCSVVYDTAVLENGDSQDLGGYTDVPLISEEEEETRKTAQKESEACSQSNLNLIFCMRSEIEEAVIDVQLTLFNNSNYAFIQHTSWVQVWRHERQKEWLKIFHYQVEKTLQLTKICVSKDENNLVLIMLLCNEQDHCLQFLLFEREARVIKVMEHTHWLKNRCSENVLLCGLNGLMFATAKGKESYEVFIHAFGSLRESPKLMTVTLGSTVKPVCSLCQIENLPNALMGVCNSMLYVWHLAEARLVTAVSLQPMDFLPIGQCFWATVENGLVFFMTTCESKEEPYVCQLLAANLATGFCQTAMTYSLQPASSENVSLKKITKAMYHEPFLIVSCGGDAFIWSVTDEYCCATLDGASDITAVTIGANLEGWGTVAVGSKKGLVECYNLN